MKLSWPFGQTEHRAGYTDLVEENTLARVNGEKAPQGQLTAASEVAASFYSGALAQCMVSPPLPILSPDFLALSGREMALRGEAIFAIMSDPTTGLSLVPASYWDITGNAPRETWAYFLTLYGPTHQLTLNLPSAGVVHLMYSTRANQPWCGESPITSAGWTAKLAGGSERQLAQESRREAGYIVPIPSGTPPDKATGLRTKLDKLKGGYTLAETTASGFGRGLHDAPRADYVEKRLGMSPPESLVKLRADAQADLLGSFGIHPSMCSLEGDGVTQRESFRRWIELYVKPLCSRIGAELSDKLEQPITLTPPPMWTTDLRSVASALTSVMTASGRTVDQAADLLGIELE